MLRGSLLLYSHWLKNVCSHSFAVHLLHGYVAPPMVNKYSPFSRDTHHLYIEFVKLNYVTVGAAAFFDENTRHYICHSDI